MLLGLREEEDEDRERKIKEIKRQKEAARERNVLEAFVLSKESPDTALLKINTLT